jgi:dihydrofolate reductase
MRKIIVTTMLTLDGVMQAPGGPEEDASEGFKYGGWSAPYGDDVFDKELAKEMVPSDYLLGRRTYEIFNAFWPKHADIWPAIGNGMKYVVSSTIAESDWENTTFITDVSEIEKVKNSAGADLQVWGSGQLVQLLLQHDLVDELWLKILPITLGSGKKLFGEGTIPAAFKLTDSTVTPSGVIMTRYARNGEVRTGTVGV